PPKGNPWARKAFFRHLDTLPLLPGLKEAVREQVENSSAPEGMTHLVVILLLGPGMREVASVFME
ncbi:hypothetical protein, partial [Thermus sp.]|uniref:hypothetical protein n=1 Tax=Thermus sp. TaxID=275 RepID=UPI0025F640BF